MSGLAAIPGVEALVVGDVMLDEYVWGKVERISPEAPVPVVEVRDTSRAPGGAANAAAGLVALGCTARLVGVVGADGAAEGLRAALAERRVGADELVVEAGRSTTVKTRVIAHAQQVVRTDFESSDPISDDVESELIAAIRSHMESADVLILSDYGKGVIGESVATAAIGAAADLDKPIVVDSKGRSYAKYRGCDGAHAQRSRRRPGREHPYRERLRPRGGRLQAVGSHRRGGSPDHSRRGRNEPLLERRADSHPDRGTRGLRRDGRGRHGRRGPRSGPRLRDVAAGRGTPGEYSRRNRRRQGRDVDGLPGGTPGARRRDQPRPR